MTFLLDTNTVIYLINDRLAMVLPAGRYGVSVITEIELLSFHRYVKPGWLPANWGSSIESLNDAHFGE